MSAQTGVSLLVGVLVLGLLVYRQLRSRPVRNNLRLLVVLVVIGLIETYGYLHKVHDTTAVVVALAGSLVLAAVFGVARAYTVRIWEQDGQPWMKGNVLTAVLWVAAIAAHLGYDYLIGRHHGLGSLGDATVLLYLVVSLGLQRYVVSYRAQRMGLVSAGFVAPGR